MRSSADGGHERTLRLSHEVSPRPEYSRLESSGREAKQGACLSARHFVVVSHGKRLSKRRFHFCEQYVDELESFSFRTNHFRIGLRRRNPFGPGSLTRGGGFRKGVDPRIRPFSQDHESSVQHDAGEPGRESRPTFKIAQVDIG